MRYSRDLVSSVLLSVSLVALLLTWSPIAHAWRGHFDPDRVHVVDAWLRPDGEYNVLFRGNEPTLVNDNGTVYFAYDAVRSRMVEVLRDEKSLPFPQKFSFLDYNLLNIFEEKDIAVERDFFHENPSLGIFTNWPTIGDLVNPNNLPEWIARDLGRTLPDWQVDRLHKRIPALHTMLHTNSSVPWVGYIHCEAGEDRTGEVSAAYYMQFNGLSLHDALYIDDHVEKRDIEPLSRNAIIWYCYYLKEALGFSSLNCEQT